MTSLNRKKQKYKNKIIRIGDIQSGIIIFVFWKFSRGVRVGMGSLDSVLSFSRFPQASHSKANAGPAEGPWNLPFLPWAIDRPTPAAEVEG